jgi:uncharacterized Zn-binding protein involved in type VI secretion
MCPYHPLHVGHIGEGSPNVFINKLPAGRIGDLVICPAPCYVAEGSPNVFINDIATRDAGKGSLTSATVRAAAKAQPTAKLWKQAGLI